jgi:hypothetical protein
MSGEQQAVGHLRDRNDAVVDTGDAGERPAGRAGGRARREAAAGILS